MHPEPDVLARVPLFAGLPEAQREQLAAWLEVEDIERGKRPARQGRSDYQFFVPQEGHVLVELEGRTPQGAGDVFGEIALFGEGRRTADASADTDTRVRSM
jgi:CRP/FNR family cyclic AMP-dependent transcriptional regulator